MYKENGGLYIGHFKNGRAQGRGAYIFEDGSYYYGDFNQNRAETENGKYQNDQITYEGGFRNNKFHGKAYEKGTNYDFEGYYNDGARERGILTWDVENGRYRY